jgi:hypothetical protein
MSQEVPPRDRAPDAGTPADSPRAARFFPEYIEGALVPVNTLENEHRLAQAKAQAEFDRDEKRKQSDHQRTLSTRYATFELCRDGLITVVVVILLLVSVIYANPWTMPATAPSDARQFAITLWTSVISGGAGYIFGRRDRPAN